MEEAAGLDSTGQTAVLICEKAEIKGGERILVNGGSGGGGTMVIQVVKAIGAKEVVATCSEKNVSHVRELGADDVVDYKAHDSLTKYLTEKYGAEPFDTVGNQELATQSSGCLKPDGPAVNVNVNEGVETMLLWGKNAILPTALNEVPRKYIMFMTILDMRMSGIVADLAETYKLKTIIAQTFKMEDASEVCGRSSSHPVLFANYFNRARTFCLAREPETKSSSRSRTNKCETCFSVTIFFNVLFFQILQLAPSI